LKTFKLAKAELKKIFLKPIMPLVFFALVISISLLSITFEPQKRVETIVNVNKTNQVQTIYNDFLDDSNLNSKKKFDGILLDEVSEITEFFANYKTDDDGDINKLRTLVSETKNTIASIYSSILNYNQIKNDDSKTGADVANARNLVVGKFTETLNKTQAVRSYFQNIQANGINFFITEENSETFEFFFRNLFSTIPTSFPIRENDALIFQTDYNFLNDSFDFNIPAQIINSLKYFNITQESFQPVLDKYYNDVLDSSNLLDTAPKLNKLFSEIKAFNQLHAESDDSIHLEQMQTYISQYKSIATMNATVLENEFLLAKAGNISDTEIRNYIGFIEFNGYQIRQTSNLNKYLIVNDLYDYDYLNAFSYNQNSGQSTNAFDFVIYAMQIISLIIAIFAIFVASGTIANEQNTGTMKMIAIRPYSRNKIITAKLYSVINFMLIMLVLSFASTFAVGYFSYGVEQTLSLLVFNAQEVFVLNSFVVLAIYFVSLFLKMTFFIVIALLFSLLFKSNTISIVLSVVLYGFTLIGNALLFSQSWFSNLPIAHLDIFRFFGTGANTGDFFGFSYMLNSNFYSSLIYLGGTILLSYFISVRIFKTRNIA
jgi:ABC-2 type transport system permease protein